MTTTPTPAVYKAILTQDRLREVLAYNEATGVFTWRIRIGSRGLAGDVAGSLGNRGYINIFVDRKVYRAHRLAFLYVTGDMPRYSIDHINGIKTDNSFANLRDVTNSVNLQNLKKARADSRSGLMGAHRLPGTNERWQARITVAGRRISLGVFQSPSDANAAYLIAKRQFHEGNTL